MLAFYKKLLITPLSKEKDVARREFILNVLLLGLIILSGLAFLINVIYIFFYHNRTGESPIVTGIITGIFVFFLILSRKGKSYISASLFVSLLFFVATYANYEWGADLSINLLLFAFIIVMAGILVGTKFAFLTTILSGSSIMAFTYWEIMGITHPNRIRRFQSIQPADSLVNVIVLCIIALVSWLFNRESEHALQRARVSELALKRQKETLEELVEKRTRQLRQAQIEKVTQLYRFAEFGRMASGLFHDLVGPLNLVSLNLQQLNDKTKKFEQEEVRRILDRIVLGTKQLESFIFAARKQIQNQEVQQFFSLEDEISQAKDMLAYKAKQQHVSVQIDAKEKIQTFGNPLKFNQTMTNLLSNALDAYDGSKKNNRRVLVHLQQRNNHAAITLQDWGNGIPAKYLPKIFDPLFTTKTFDKGTGMGLAICRDIIKKEFQGSIQVRSEEKMGTTFTISFPIKTDPSANRKKTKKN